MSAPRSPRGFTAAFAPRSGSGARFGSDVAFQRFSRQRWRVLWAIALLALALPSAAQDDAGDPPVDEQGFGERASHAGAVALDVLVLRPLGAAATVGGFGCFLITAPMMAPSGEHMTAWDVFVLGPADYTFQRPLGDF